MHLRILYVSATDAEADILKKISGIVPVSSGYRLGNCEIYPLVTGVGSISTAWGMKQWLYLNQKPHLAINAGIAGSYRDNIAIGEVVMPVFDCFADMGIETEKGFLTLSEAGLSNPDKFPFKSGFIPAENRFILKLEKYLKPVKAITVNTATGSVATIDRIVSKYNPDIETMEGATFFYVCAMEKLPFLAIRAISNRVVPDNRKKWDISLALNNMSIKLKDIIYTLE